MADGLDIVAVGIEDEGAVVVRVIMRPQARPAIVLAAGGKGGGMERIDLSAAARGEGDMLMGPRLIVAGLQPEHRPVAAITADLGAAGVLAAGRHR